MSLWPKVLHDLPSLMPGGLFFSLRMPEFKYPVNQIEIFQTAGGALYSLISGGSDDSVRKAGQAHATTALKMDVIK
jgi:hypothetical protein